MAALFEAMEERQATIDGERYPLSPIFTVLATENPIEYEGTYPLPEAQLDRFLMKILIDYPDADEEKEIVARWDAGFNSRHLEHVQIIPLPDANAIHRCRMEVREMRMEHGVQKYIVEIVRRTRTHPTILYGASPRASVALLCSCALPRFGDATFQLLTTFAMLQRRFCVIVLRHVPRRNLTERRPML